MNSEAYSPHTTPPKHKAGEDWHPRLLVAVAPVYLWLLAITSLPHKEERFLYVVYPLVR